MGYLKWVIAILILFFAWIKRASNRSIGYAQTSHYQQTRERPVARDVVITLHSDNPQQQKAWADAVHNQLSGLRDDTLRQRW